MSYIRQIYKHRRCETVKLYKAESLLLIQPNATHWVKGEQDKLTGCKSKLNFSLHFGYADFQFSALAQ